MKLNEEIKINTEHKIIICEVCEGSGLDENLNICDNCEGTGRMCETKKWQIFHEPFDLKRISKQNIRYKLS